MRQSYKFARGDGGLYEGGRVGRSISGEISWQEAALSEADAEGVVALLDWVKAADEEPFIACAADRAARGCAARSGDGGRGSSSRICSPNRGPARNGACSLDSRLPAFGGDMRLVLSLVPSEVEFGTANSGAAYPYLLTIGTLRLAARAGEPFGLTATESKSLG